MTSLFFTLLAPVLVLWIGAAVFYVLDHLVPPQDAGVAEAVVLVLSVGALLWGVWLPTQGTLDSELDFGQSLIPAGWPGTPPALGTDRPTLMLALILLLTAVAASLASLAESGLRPLRRAPLPRQTAGSRDRDPRIAGRSGRMAAMGAALLFLFAREHATLALAWVVVDLCLLYVRQAAVPRDDEPVPIALSLVGAICLGLFVLVQPEEGSTPGVLATGLALAAIVLRLMPFPLPAWPLPFSQRHTLLARVFSYLVPAILGLHLCTRLVPWLWLAQLGPDRGHWLSVARGSGLAWWATVALLVSAIKAWTAREPGALIASTTLYGVAWLLLGSGLNLPVHSLQIVGMGATLHVCTLYISWMLCPYLDPADPRTWWRAAPTGAALLSLSGVPPTLGFLARAAVYAALFGAQRWLPLLLLLLAEAAMLGALLRVLLEVECVLVDNDLDGQDLGRTEAFSRPWQREVAYGAGASLALGLLVLGMGPSLLTGVSIGTWFGLLKAPAWLALLLPIAGAVLLYRKQERISAWMGSWTPVIEQALDLRWAFRGLNRVVRVLGSIVWNGSMVVEGAGYMAWVTLVGLVLLLLVRAYR